jgi:hypothetical protein
LGLPEKYAKDTSYYQTYSASVEYFDFDRFTRITKSSTNWFENERKVFEMAQRLNYVPNPAAILLKKNKTYTIGVVLPHLQEEFFPKRLPPLKMLFQQKIIM